MGISLIKASMEDSKLIHEMQAEAFKDLLDKYQDYETNPGAELLERVELRMSVDVVDHYFICLEDKELAIPKKIGSLRITRLDNDIINLGTTFILPKYEGKGYGKQAILKAEMLYPEARRWELGTIKQEAKLRHFYELLGYEATGEETQIHDDMTIIGYSKNL